MCPDNDNLKSNWSQANKTDYLPVDNEFLKGNFCFFKVYFEVWTRMINLYLFQQMLANVFVISPFVVYIL